MPRLHAAVLIAEALNLPLKYLADDDIPVEPVPAGPLSFARTRTVYIEAATRYAQFVARNIRITRDQLNVDWPSIAVQLWHDGLDGPFPENLKPYIEPFVYLIRDSQETKFAGCYTAERLKKITGIDADPDEMKMLQERLVNTPGYSLVTENIIFRMGMSTSSEQHAAGLRALIPAKLAQARAMAPHVKVDD